MSTPESGSPETCSPQDAVFAYIDGAANHEVKNLISSIFLTHPAQAYSPATMTYEMNSRQGENRAWEIKKKSVSQFCEVSLEPVGAVVKSELEEFDGRLVDAWQAAQENLDIKLAVSGFISDWSLRWGDISVQQAYGKSGSASDIRSPKIRHDIYLALMTGSDAPTLKEIGHATGRDTTPNGHAMVSAQINMLTGYGILQKNTNRVKYNPLIEVVDNTYNSQFMPLEDTSAETQALYKAVAGYTVGQIITVEQLLDDATLSDGSIDALLLRARLARALYSRNQYPGLRRIDNNGLANGKQSNVQFVDAAKQPIIELVEGIETITEPDHVEYFSQRSREIIANPDEFMALVEKARRSSPLANKTDPVLLASQIKSLLGEHGPSSAPQLRELLSEVHGKNVTILYMYQLLRDLVDSEALTVDKVEAQAYSLVTQNVYSLSTTKD
ncbi:MAG TPA: hypothetical protein VG604_02995 [Candidatus Saccharimonadales bacterium]|nr:hypothetical protein [Candidatus Saccharimonadales bacterium]